ncbi:MAG: cytochrome c [Vicinamibacterales bacterium]
MFEQLRSGRVSRLAGAAALLVSVAACRQDMHDQPKYTALQASDFFADGAASRPLVANTVARGHLNEDRLLYTGKQGDAESTVFPFAVTDEVMARGRERFDVYCSPCHGRTGLGDGMVVRRGFQRPPMLSEQRLIDAPVGHIVDVITNGFGVMSDYAAQVRPEDRWAIAAYVRALQLSAAAPIDAVPVAERGRLDAAPGGGAPATPETERR